MSRTPPFNADAERATLGAMMMNQDARVVGILACTSDDFYVPENARIFEAIVACVREGQRVDYVTIADRLDRQYPRRKDQPTWRIVCIAVQADCPLSHHADAHAAIVARLGSMRRAIAMFDRLSGHAYAGEVDAVLDGLARSDDEIAAPPPPVQRAIDLDELVAMTFENRFVVPGLIRRRDRFVLTGLEGLSGKTEFLFQWAVMFASGIHPWTRVPEFDPLRVLYIDCENELEQLQPRAALRLRGAAGDNYGGNLFIESRTIGMNLVSHPDQQWLEAMVERHAPDVLIMGPLYRLFRALPGHAKHSEETAEAFGDAIDRVRIKHDLAVILEAHAPHGKEGDRADFRPYGASYWLRWPEMGVGLKPRTRWQGRQKVPVPGEFDFVFWRGTRDFDIRRPFPQGVRRSKPWSFACDDEDVL